MNMAAPIPLLIGWILHILVCFYFIRLTRNTSIRCMLTLIPCMILTYMTGKDLPPLHMPSMLLVTNCWLISIRLIHLIVLSPNQYSTFSSFILKFPWMVFPVVACPPNYQQEWPIHYEFISGVIKLMINHWIYRWLLSCKGSDSYARLIMFFIFALSFTFLSDIQSAILRIVTRNKYMLLPPINMPFLSQSLRDFWSRRYNRLISAVLRESIFQPLLPYLSSKTITSFLVFIVSGLLHVHLAVVALKDSRAAISSMMFFITHGIACVIETYTPFKLPFPFPWLLTQFFLLATASLQIGPFTKIGPEFYAANAPPFFDQHWIPKLPVPHFCP